MKGNGCLILRADACETSGIGHAMRLLALGQAWLEQGGHVIFAAAEMPSPLLQRFEREGFEFILLRSFPGSAGDALELANLAKAAEAMVALDGYQFPMDYHVALAKSGIRFLVVDDMGFEWPSPAVLVLNQNFEARSTKYPSIPEDRLLLGPNYALLRSEFRIFFERIHPPRAQKVLITFGGSDPLNGAERAMEAAAACTVSECLVIAGPSNSHIRALRAKASQLSARCNFRIIEQASSMSEAMRWADVAVAAAGSSALEMAATGLPAVFVATAHNQEMVGAGVRREGFGFYAGKLNEAWGAVPEMLARLGEDRELRVQMSQLGRQLVDGQGAQRVASALAQAANQ